MAEGMARSPVFPLVSRTSVLVVKFPREQTLKKKIKVQRVSENKRNTGEGEGI